MAEKTVPHRTDRKLDYAVAAQGNAASLAHATGTATEKEGYRVEEQAVMVSEVSTNTAPNRLEVSWFQREVQVSDTNLNSDSDSDSDDSCSSDGEFNSPSNSKAEMVGAQERR